MRIIRPAHQQPASPRTTPSSPSSQKDPVPNHTPSDTRLIVTTPRAQALAIITRALGRGEILTIGSTTLRWLEQGEQFEESSSCYEALTSGIYQRLSVYAHGQLLDGPPSHYTWGYGLDLGQAHHWVGSLYDALTPYDREALIVGLTTRHVLQQLRTTRLTRAHPSPH